MWVDGEQSGPRPAEALCRLNAGRLWGGSRCPGRGHCVSRQCICFVVTVLRSYLNSAAGVWGSEI